MRFHGIALLASATILGACGGEKPAADTSATAATPAPAATTTPSADSTAAATATPATGAPAAGAATTGGATPGAMAAAPATGQTHEVKMIGDATGYKFDPANITVKQGDAVKFIMVTGGPHNVTFQNVTNAAAKAQLDANMPGQKMGELAGPMVMQPNEAYVISFAKVPPGKYDYICTPHAAMNMKGSITVQ
jgi:plastocyanin